MSNEFQPLALKIIKDSIVSSVYIDDKVVEPFQYDTTGHEKYLTVSKGLYDSFRSEKKSIDFYKYDANKKWEEDISYLFKNRDLVVLDWSLNDALGLKQVETLKILKKAVNTDNLHFVSIYTETPEKDFEEICYTIKSFFNSSFKQDSKQKCQILMDELEAEGVDTSFFSDLASTFKEYALLGGTRKEEVYKSLKEQIQQELTTNYPVFVKKMRVIDNAPEIACEILGYFINSENFIEALDSSVEINTNHLNENFLVINHTIIQVTNKSSPKPEELFQFFTDAIQKICGNLLTLISLEIRNLLRESSAFIGKDADSIEDAILFHQKNKKDSFLEFLMTILKSHVFSSFNYRHGKLESIKDVFWDGYNQHNKISPQKIDELDQNEKKKIDQLLKLNVYYNELHVSKVDGDIVKFGDIFANIGPNGKSDGKFFLCITAHCDCLKPKENIKNNFYFIAGERYDKAKAIMDGDGEFNSFIKFQNEIIAIRWQSRPIIYNIINNQLQNLQVQAVDGLSKAYNFNFITTLKDNYAQRMANNSFSFAMRVGIDFTSF